MVKLLYNRDTGDYAIKIDGSPTEGINSIKEGFEYIVKKLSNHNFEYYHLNDTDFTENL